jgi:hypothetical protein
VRSKRKWFVFVAAAVVSTGVSVPAHAVRIRVAHCQPSQTLIRVEQKICPARPTLPAIVLERACCLRKDGKMRCQNFQPCPSRSPS